ncbi:PucR family transcriptional regulator [Streptomyces sp. NBC_01304]|uniref:PucR family transcriptional regulator n=1 Tax=Streptomyces sp. NBC_01304 TaxID=2903818 RepID=UPI002E1081CE|nr:helix-turn-helix domain-containing protein [Streptomyces sp. NBC_01304]
MLSTTAQALAQRVEPRVPELARRMAREAFATLPGYAQLPGDIKDMEIAATARHGIRLFLRRVADPGIARADLRLFRERAAQRAEEGMPLHLLLRTHSLGMYVLWQALREAAGPGEEADLAELVDLLLASHHRVVGAVAETYVDERAALDADVRAQRRSLVRGLLDGVLPAGHVLLDELRLHGPASVLALRVADGAGPGSAPKRGPVAERRLQRRLQSALDQAFGTEVPALLEGDLGRAVAPGPGTPPDDLAARLSRAAGAPVRVACVPVAAPDEIPGAARTATEILRITRACGLPPGLHRLEDVLLEFHLSRPNESSHRIAALLDPLTDRPELLQTLRTHLAEGQDRRGTAATLGLHPNTVDNRLAKIAEQTGLDLSAPRGTALAIAALLLRDAARDPESESVDGPSPVRGAGGGPPSGPDAGPSSGQGPSVRP